MDATVGGALVVAIGAIVQAVNVWRKTTAEKPGMEADAAGKITAAQGVVIDDLVEELDRRGREINHLRDEAIDMHRQQAANLAMIADLQLQLHVKTLQVDDLLARVEALENGR